MCQQVVINRGVVEIGTVKQFEDFFKTKVAGEDLTYDCCLCQIDVGAELRKINVAYGYDHCDYFVGLLDELKEADPDMEFWPQY